MRKNLVKNKVKLISASAGFPSPAENYVEEKLNLNSYLLTLFYQNLQLIYTHPHQKNYQSDLQNRWLKNYL